MSEIWIIILTGAVGCLIVLGVQEAIFVYRKTKKAKLEKTLKSRNYDKIINNSVLYNLQPGANIELMRELLGTPIKFNKSDWSVFKESEAITNSCLYIFENTSLKITSKDDRSINSLTIIGYDSSIELESIAFDSENNEYRLNKAVVCKDILDYIDNHTIIQSRIDASFALQIYVSNPLYKSYTYFGSPVEKVFIYNENKDLNIFINENITGFFVSNNTDDSYFIYDMEYR